MNLPRLPKREELKEWWARDGASGPDLKLAATSRKP